MSDEEQKSADKPPFWKSPFIRHTVLVICLLTLMSIVGGLSAHEARRIAASWSQNLSPTAAKGIENFSAIQTTPQEKERLISQLNLARLRAQHHLNVAVYFFSNYYMSLLVTFVSGAVAAVALFFIVKKGWQAVNPYVVTVFITMSTVATAYGAFPGVFRQHENVAENKTLYLRYVALQNEILSYSATRKNSAGELKTASQFIIYLDQEFNRVNNLAIGFDATKIPVFQFEVK
jgi:ABC-type multidrug transport system fused ATPase/permease subunit